jgi:hypothetical protein
MMESGHMLTAGQSALQSRGTAEKPNLTYNSQIVSSVYTVYFIIVFLLNVSTLCGQKTGIQSQHKRTTTYTRQQIRKKSVG